MGIVNTTPDSFSDGGQFASDEVAVAHARRLVSQGATIVDIGGESTRPGGQPVPVDEELRRVLPVITALANDGNVLISIDTYKSAVAAAAVEAGAHLVNDVSGLGDPAMASTCGELGVPMVIMHMKGTPATMQNNPVYDDVVAEVSAHLAERADTATRAGVPSVFVDPGIGFGKTLVHNTALLRSLPIEGVFPTLVGVSRKRSIGEWSGVSDPALRDAGSIAAHLDAARRGVAMVRVHDVAGHVQALAVQAAILQDQPVNRP
jgi:dihydropteroate synthase